jgi:isopentenyl diphosphate isomerase/L-lactate dehydrogenase-like FMN-dependent dehydrogenase
MTNDQLPVTFKQWETRAEEMLKKDAFDYIAGGAGEAGVKQVIRHMLEEFNATMALAGVRSMEEITADLLVEGS